MRRDFVGRIVSQIHRQSMASGRRLIADDAQALRFMPGRLDPAPSAWYLKNVPRESGTRCRAGCMICLCADCSEAAGVLGRLWGVGYVTAHWADSPVCDTLERKYIRRVYAWEAGMNWLRCSATSSQSYLRHPPPRRFCRDPKWMGYAGTEQRYGVNSTFR
jgi:hypothetical protein